MTSDICRMPQMATSSLSIQTLPQVSSSPAVWRSMSSRVFTNPSRMFTLPSRGGTMSSLSARSKSQWGDESYSDFVLIFNRSTLTPFISYLIIDKKVGHASNIFPKMNSMFMTRLKDIVEYRTVVVDNQVYILGGLHVESQSVLSYCHRFDPSNCQWQTLASMTRGRCRFAASVMAGYIYVTGGVVRDGRATNSVERYDLITDTWTEIKSMPEARMNHSMCASRNKIYISGGVGRKKTTQNTCSFWQYDPQSDFWWPCTNLPHARWDHCMTDHRGIIYCVGGETIKRRNHQYVDMYDTTMCCIESSLITTESGMNGKWRHKECAQPHQPRTTPGMFSLGHRLYLVGGNFNGESVNTIEYYSPPRKKWIQCFQLGNADFSSVDCVVVRVPQHNKHFNHLTHAMHEKFIFW